MPRNALNHDLTVGSWFEIQPGLFAFTAELAFSRNSSYTPLLGPLCDHPAVWKRLVASDRLDRRTMMDYRNFRPTGELP